MSLSLVCIIYSLFNYNPMYSLIFFFFFIFNLVMQLFIQNYEFIPLLIGLIYFGAILILFFFILLLINLQIITRDNLHLKRISLAALPIIFIIINMLAKEKQLGLFICNSKYHFNILTNLETISLAMFNDFGLYIIIVGIILFLTLIGIVLILVSNKNIQLVKYEKVSK